jgi:hypothetical protein
MKPLWQKLKVGDKVRLAEMPPEFLVEGYYLHRDTKRLYKRLVARRRHLRIAWIDEFGFPWAQCRADKVWHAIALNHGGLIKVKKRKNKCSPLK